MGDYVGVLAVNLAVIAGLMLTLWVVSLRLRDASIVDPFWSLGFVLVALATFLTAGGTAARRTLVLVLVAIWGIRLSAYLFWRNHGKGEDFRYRAMRERHGDRFPIVSLYTVFGLQGLLMFLVSLPIPAAMVPDSPDHLIWLDYVGIAFWAVGLFFEAVGDYQLTRFKADPANRGKVMDRGLWRYTRHPNYFGDFMVWWGVFLIALSTGVGAWSVIGPLVMSTLLIRVSGKGLLEKTIGKRREGYAEYVRRTSGFFPRPPRP